MADRGQKQVDAEIKLELAEFKVSMNEMISNLIKAGFKEIQDHLTELFNKDIDYIKDTQERHADHHTSHFENDKSRIQDISEIKTLIIEHRTIEMTKDKIEDKTNRKKEIGMGHVLLICGIVSVLTAIITLLLK